MSTDRYFPSLSEEAINDIEIVRRLMEDDPHYLDDPECPYSDNIRDFLLSISVKGAGQRGEGSRIPGADDLVEEILDFRRQLDEIGERARGMTDPAVTNTYFRLRAALLEKTLELRERAARVKEVQEFQRIVIGFLDDECTPDQRTKLMNRLDDYMGITND